MVNNNYPVDIPKTYTVSYFDEAEWNKDLTLAEIVQQQEIVDLQNQLGEFEKGSGPCYYSNPNCTHYTDQGWIQLYLGCPATDCTDRFREGGGASTWVHATCENPIYVSKNLEIKCISCNNPSNMLNWSFNCFSRKHKGGYRETSYELVANALTMLSNENRNRDKRVRDIIKTISDKLWDM